MPNFPFLRRIPALLAGSLPVLASYASASNADVTTEYALAQQGFAIALASTARGAGRRDSAFITAACSSSAAASATPSAFRS